MAITKAGILSAVKGYSSMLNPGFLPRTVNKAALRLLPNGRTKSGLLALNDLLTGQTGTQAVTDAASSVIGNVPPPADVVVQKPAVQQPAPERMTLLPSSGGVASGMPAPLTRTNTGFVPFRSPPSTIVPPKSVQAQPDMASRLLTGAYNLEGGLRGGTAGRAGRIGVSRMADRAGMRPVLDGSGKVSFVPMDTPGQVKPGTRMGIIPADFQQRFPVRAKPNAMPGFGETGSGVLNEDFVNDATNRVQGAVRNSMPHLNGIRGVTNAFLGANMTATGMTPEQQHLANLAKTDATKERMMRDTQTVGRIRGNAASAEASRQFDETQKTARAVGLAAGMTPQYTKTAQGVWVDQKGNPAGSDVAGRLDTEEYRGKQLDYVSNLDPSLETAGGMFSGAKQYGINRATGEFEVVPVSELNKEDKKRTHDPLPAELRAKLGSARSNFKTIEEVAAALGANKIDRATAEKEYTRIKGAKK